MPSVCLSEVSAVWQYPLMEAPLYHHFFPSFAYINILATPLLDDILNRETGC